MKKAHHQILSYVYEEEEVGIRELSSLMARGKGDHRDFYGLVALLQAGYVGFTGPVHSDATEQAHLFQCYAQGQGLQQSGNVQLLPSDNDDSYLYIGARGIEYFHQRSEARKGWILAAVFSLVASVISGVVVSQLTSPHGATERGASVAHIMEER